MTAWGTLRSAAAAKISAGFGRLFSRANRINVTLLERADPLREVRVDGATLRFHCPSALTLWRVNTLLSKEPDTIEWIDGFDRGDLLCDIGANIGLYTVYAAMRGARVMAFEPEAQNYALLNRNIHVNGVDETAAAYNVALGDRCSAGRLFVPRPVPGSALNNFGTPSAAGGGKPQFRQAVLAFTLDEFLARYELPVPHHVKIDVDGLESAVIDGMSRSLADPTLRSVLVEIDEAAAADREIVPRLETAGFRALSRYRAPMFADSRFKDTYNYIFRR